MMRINLRAVREDSRKEKIKQQAVVGVLILLVPFVIIGFWDNSISSQITAKQGQIRKTEDEIKKIKQVIGEVDKFKEAKKGLEQKLTIIGSLEDNRLGPVLLMDELAKAVPERLWLTELSQKGGNIEIKGESLDTNNISAFMDRLEKSEMFSGVTLGETKMKNAGSYKIYGFKLSFNAKGLVVATPAGASSPTKGKPAKKRGRSSEE